MRFVGHILKGAQEIACAGVTNNENEKPDSVASRARASLVRDLKWYHPRIYHATSEEDRLILSAFTLLQEQFGECIKKTMVHGKDALASVHVRGEDVTIVENVNTVFSPGSEPDMILHFRAMSDESVAESTRFVESLLSNFSDKRE